MMTMPLAKSQLGVQVAFALCGFMMIAAMLLLLVNRPSFIKKKPSGSVLTKTYRIVMDARSTGRGREGAHWLDAALDHDHTAKDVEAVKSIFKMLPVFCVFPIFWSLQFQQGSLWLLQAAQMDLNLNVFTSEPKVMMPSSSTGALNTLFVLGLLPLFDNLIFPFLQRCACTDLQALNRMPVGMLLASAAFVCAGFLQIHIEANPVRCNGFVNASLCDNPQGGVSFLWLLPQYFIMACAEVLFSPASLQFCFDECDAGVVVTVRAIYFLAVTAGNVFDGIIFTSLGGIVSASAISFVYSAIMLINVVVFACVRRTFLSRKASLGPALTAGQPSESNRMFKSNACAGALHMMDAATELTTPFRNRKRSLATVAARPSWIDQARSDYAIELADQENNPLSVGSIECHGPRA